MKHRSYFKVAAVFSLALAVSALLFTALVDVNPVHANGGYGVPLAGGRGGHPARSLEVDLSGVETKYVINREGELQETVECISDDKMLILTLPEGTIALDEENEPLKRLEITVEEYPPPPPEGANFIGLVYNFVGLTYDFEPSRVTFIPSMAITFYYEHSMLPEGVAEDNLIPAWWDEESGQWIPLEVFLVAPDLNIITAPISHFTPFAILAKLPPAPAAFAVSDLAVSPAKVNVGEAVTISVLVTNTGELSGSYQVTLKVNGVVVATKEVTVAGGSSQKVTFTTTKNVAGTYTVDVNGLVDRFVVKAPLPPAPAAFKVSQLSISPTAVQVGEKVTISATVANTGEVEGSYTVTLKINGATEATKKVTLAGGQSTKVTFSVVRDVAGSYQVNVDGQVGSFTVAKAPLAWWIWLIVGLVVVAIIVAVVIWLRRRAY